MKAEGAVTTFAIEVDMLVIKRALLIAIAYLITQGTTTILDCMNKMMLKEECEGSEDCATLGCLHSIFKFTQGQRTMSLFQFLIDKQTHSGKLNSTMFKPMFEVHIMFNV